MARIYAQAPEVVLETTASLANGATISGSLISDGYARLSGMFISNTAMSACGLRVEQSSDRGATWDSASLYTVAACAGSVFDFPIYGNAVRVTASNTLAAASLIRGYFGLRVIGSIPMNPITGSITLLTSTSHVGNVALETSTSNIGNVYVLTGGSRIGNVALETSTSNIGNVALLTSTSNVGNFTIYQQTPLNVWTCASNLAGSTTSGSFSTLGYSRLVGHLITCTSSVATSGLSIYQGSTGSALDYVSASAVSACIGYGYSIEVIGNAAKIAFIPDTTASIFRTAWSLRPI